MCVCVYVCVCVYISTDIYFPWHDGSTDENVYGVPLPYIMHINNILIF